MPIYEYRCGKCGNQIEVMQKFSDPAPTPCAKCNAADSFEKLISHTSFQLKGGGWYSDLYSSVKKDSSSTAAPTGASTSSTPATPAASTSTSTAAAPASAPSGGSSSSGSGSGSGSSGSGGTSSS